MAAKYSPQDALTCIRKTLHAGGYWFPTLHCKRDSMPKRNVDDLDIDVLLQETGQILSEPEWDNERSNYKYEVVGLDASKDELTAIVVIDDENGRVVVITVY